MEQAIPEECAETLSEAVQLFINYSIQNYIKCGIIEAHEKPALMSELWERLKESSLGNHRTFSNEKIASTCFSFE